jgi:hypothetical protein
MDELTCKCGRKFTVVRRSTIKPKLCPSCTYKQQVSHHGEHSRTTRKGKPPKEKNASYWMKEADRWFSRYIRISKSIIKDGEPICRDIITGKYYHAKNVDNGHLFSRAIVATRYNVLNCWPQNRSSNRFRGEADKELFRQNVIEKIGEELYTELEVQSKTSGKFGKQEFAQMAEMWKAFVNDLVEKNKINKWW